MAEAQVFVKIDEYKDVLRTIGLMKSKLNDAKDTLQKIKELKGQEDTELENWDNKLVEIENKIEGIDNVLFEPSSI
jgi:predicted  nucleic acid-binding Zn-ribbon protein